MVVGQCFLARLRYRSITATPSARAVRCRGLESSTTMRFLWQNCFWFDVVFFRKQNRTALQLFNPDLFKESILVKLYVGGKKNTSNLNQICLYHFCVSFSSPFWIKSCFSWPEKASRWPPSQWTRIHGTGAMPWPVWFRRRAATCPSWCWLMFCVGQMIFKNFFA